MNTSSSSSHTPETWTIKRAWSHNMHLTKTLMWFRCHIPHLTPTYFNGTLIMVAAGLLHNITLELSYNSSMYSFKDPASLTDQSSSQSISRSIPATKSHIGTKKGGSGSVTVTPQSMLGNNQSEAVGSYRLADMLDR